MAELIPTADEAAWLAARRQGVTASEIAVIMGLSPYDSAYALYHRKLGTLGEQPDSAAMERGRVLEPYIAAKFAERHPEYAVTGTGRELYAHWSWPWRMATPDRLVHDVERGHWANPPELGGLAAVLECKVDGGSDEWGEQGTDEIPVHYRCQVIWQMDVMDVSTAYVACLDPGRWKIREYVIGHGEGCGPGRNLLAYPSLSCAVCDDLAVMLDAAGEFRKRLRDGEPPDVDWRPATADALKKLHSSVTDTDAPISSQLASWYYAACQNAKHWEQRKKLYEARIREAIGPARRAVDPGRGGQVIARRDVYEVREHVRKASTVDKLTPVYPKENKHGPDGE